VNGSRIEDNQEVVLKDGDEIVFAQDEITLVFSDPNQTARLTGLPKIAENRDVRVDARIYINVASKEVRIDGKKIEPLSRKEFDILLGLYRNSGNVTSREEIADAGWPERPNGDVSPEEIDQYISRLRRRLEKNPKRPFHIVTRRGFGYQFNN
jgi:DNA-binding response OmpR family regulator